jgi:hypothetical protein
MDKKVMYALIGGASIIGVAVAFHLLNKNAEEADETLDNDLEKVGPLELDT